MKSSHCKILPVTWTFESGPQRSLAVAAAPALINRDCPLFVTKRVQDCTSEKPTRSTLPGLFARFQTFNLLSLELCPESNFFWPCLLWLPLPPGILLGPASQTFENYFKVGGIILVHFTLQRKKAYILWVFLVNKESLPLHRCVVSGSMTPFWNIFQSSCEEQGGMERE